jgi:hypothetical protein
VSHSRRTDCSVWPSIDADALGPLDLAVLSCPHCWDSAAAPYSTNPRVLPEDAAALPTLPPGRLVADETCRVQLLRSLTGSSIRKFPRAGALRAPGHGRTVRILPRPGGLRPSSGGPGSRTGPPLLPPPLCGSRLTASVGRSRCRHGQDRGGNRAMRKELAGLPHRGVRREKRGAR